MEFNFPLTSVFPNEASELNLKNGNFLFDVVTTEVTVESPR